FVLRCDAKWVEHPEHFELMNQQRQFNIRIDAAELEEGVPHYTELQAFDADHIEMGPLFRVPITVILPVTVDESTQFVVTRDLTLKPAEDQRLFVHVPEGADWAMFKFQSHDRDHFARYVFHAVQLLPNESYRSHESYKMVTLSEQGESTQAMAVVGGRTLELCITKWWSSLGDSSGTYTLAFRGNVPIPTAITILSCDATAQFGIGNGLAFEEVHPAITFRHVCHPTRPVDSRVEPLGPRDLFHDGRQIYRLLLTYSFTVHKGSEVCFLRMALIEDLSS
uniref:Tripeptidyl peptidase II Ig-like domain-containing protein n=1 Tax=Plectus sambesii TaxID=2011161 RepID=A0A914UV78_9BILA